MNEKVIRMNRMNDVAKTGKLNIPEYIKKKLDYINNKYFDLSYINKSNLQMRFLTLKKLFDVLGEKYKIDYRRAFVVYSIFNGNNLNSYFYCNFKKIVYWDFDTNKKYNWLEALYTKYGNKLFDAITKLFDAKPKVTKPTIIVKDRAELYAAIKENMDKKILVLAGTGFGKSSTLKKISKEHKILMIEPLNVQVAQEYYVANQDTACLWQYAAQIDRLRNWDNVKLLFTTSAQIKEYYNDYENLKHLTIVDEAHTLISDMSYRGSTINKVWQLIENKDNWIMMTATAKFCNLEEYCDIIIKVENQEKENRFVRKCIIKDKINITYYDAICSQIKKSDERYGNKIFHIIYIDNEKELQTYKEHIEKILPYKSIKLITSNEVEANPKLLDDIIKHRQIESNILLCTRKLSMGYHIEQNGIFEFHIINGDINIIEQMINRIRHYDSNGIKLSNSVICNIYTKNAKWKYIDYNKKFDLYYNNLKEFVSKIKFDENKFIYDDFMIKLKFSNEYTLKGLIYEALVAESKYNTEYLVKEIINSGWYKIDDIEITFANKVKPAKKNLNDKKKIFAELLDIISTEINNGKGYVAICNDLSENTKHSTIRKNIKYIKDACSLNKLEDLHKLVNDEKMTYNKIIRQVNNWKIKNDMSHSNMQELIASYVKDRDYIPTSELKAYIGNIKKANSIIKAIMQELGYIAKVKNVNNKNVRCWCKVSA